MGGAALILALVAAVPPDDPRDVVVRVTAAVEADSAASVRPRWQARLAQDPADPAAILALATLDRLTYDYASAERGYRMLFTGDPRFAAHARLGWANALFYQGRLGEIEALTVRARADARASGDRAAEGEALYQMTRSVALVRGIEFGVAMLDSALLVLPEWADDTRSEVRCLRAQYRMVAGTETAPQELRAALAFSRRVENPRAECMCLRAVSLSHRFAGQADSAIVVLRQVEEIRRRIGDRARLAEALFLRGDAAIQAVDYGQALEAWRAALVEARVSRNDYVDASVKLALGALYFNLNDAITAGDYVNQAAAAYEALADTGGLMMARSWRMSVHVAKGNLDAARRETNDAIAFFRHSGDTPHLAELLETLADIELRSRNWKAAEAALDEARALLLAHSSGASGSDQSRDRGRLALKRGDLVAAGRHFERYQAGLDSTDRLERFEARAYRAEVHARRGELELAEREIRKGSDELDAWRATLEDRELVALAFQASSRDANDRNSSVAEVVARLASGGREVAAFEIAERRRGRDLADRMRRAAPSAASGATSNAAALPRGARAIAEAIPDDSTAILEFATGAAGAPTTGFLLRRPAEGRAWIRAVVLPPADSLVAGISRWLGLIEDGSDAPQFAAGLGQTLLAALTADLGPEVRRLVIVPDGPLHRVPFDALRLPDGRHAVERFAISFAPSAGIAIGLWRRGVTPAGAGARLLAFGNPVLPRTPAQPESADAAAAVRSAFDEAGGLAPIGASAAEVRRAARYAGVSEVRVGAAASAAELKRMDLRGFQVLHFATHALVDEHTATRTALVLAPGADESGFVGPGEIAALRLDADLVVLSACRSAAGVVVDGEGLQGLTAPLLQAGARSVVATGWRVGDRSAARFVDAMYEGLASGLSAGDALSAAKLRMLREGRPPREWAAFRLDGDPSVRIALRAPAPGPPAGVIAAVAGALLVLVALWVWRRRSAKRMAAVP